MFRMHRVQLQYLTDQLKVENRIKEGAENLLQMPLTVSARSLRCAFSVITITVELSLRCGEVGCESGMNASTSSVRIYVRWPSSRGREYHALALFVISVSLVAEDAYASAYVLVVRTHGLLLGCPEG